jgi:hypothetical protein
VTSMHFIGLDIHKKTISYCVKDVSGTVLSEGTLAATRAQLDDWVKTLASSGFRRNARCPCVCPWSQVSDEILTFNSAALVTSNFPERAAPIRTTSSTCHGLSVLLPSCLNNFLDPLSSPLIQLTIDTCTAASPDHA